MPGQGVGELIPPYLLPTVSINVMLNETVAGDFPTSFCRFTNQLYERVIPWPGALGLQLYKWLKKVFCYSSFYIHAQVRKIRVVDRPDPKGLPTSSDASLSVSAGFSTGYKYIQKDKYCMYLQKIMFWVSGKHYLTKLAVYLRTVYLKTYQYSSNVSQLFSHKCGQKANLWQNP